MPTHPFISVIVPVYNGEQYIEKCLTSLINQSYPKDRYEIIVVNNNSEDRTVELAEPFNVLVLDENKRSSYAARNRGIEHAQGEIIAFIDVDCVATESWLGQASEAFVTANIKFLSGKVEFMTENKLKTWGYYDVNSYLNQEQSAKIGHAVTANFFVHKDLFTIVGLFNGELRSGGDGEWSRRALKVGYPVTYDERVIVYHPVRNSFVEIAGKSYRIGFGKGQMARKNKDFKFMFHWRHLVPPARKFFRLVMNDEKLKYRIAFLIKMQCTALFLQIMYNMGKWAGYLKVHKNRVSSHEHNA